MILNIYGLFMPAIFLKHNTIVMYYFQFQLDPRLYTPSHTCHHIHGSSLLSSLLQRILHEVYFSL